MQVVIDHINKKILEMKGKLFIYYPIKASLDALKIDKAIYTDDEGIAKAYEEHGAIVIPNPNESDNDMINHGDVIKHAAE